MRESGGGPLRTLASPGAGLVEIRDGTGGRVRIARGDLPTLLQMLRRDLRYLERER